MALVPTQRRGLGWGIVPAVLVSPPVRTWLLVVLGVVAAGTAVYVVVLGWPVDDALYMTVITLTTVGFHEVRPLDDIGRAWTGLLAIAGVGIIFGTIGIVVESLVGDLTSGRREARRMAREIAALRDHFVLCGYGRVGSTVATELARAGNRIVVIDNRPESLEQARHDGHLVLSGDATSDETLRDSGIERARGLIAAIDSDANNVYVVLSARSLNPALFILGRANSAGAEAKLMQAGADRAVSPYTMAGRRIAELAIKPHVADFIDLALSRSDVAFALEELEVVQGGSLAGRDVGGLRSDGIFTLAIVPTAGGYQGNPPDDRRLVAGERLVVSGSAERLARIRAEA